MSDIQGIMKFEFLPNEILLECFEYFNAFNIFYSFDQLISRINNLIRHVPLYVTLQDVNKSMFDQFCTKMILNPDIQNQMYSIHFPDEQEHLLYKLFLSYFSLNIFSNLRKLDIMKRFKSIALIRPMHEPSELYLEIKAADVPLSKLQILSVSTINSFEEHFHEFSSLIRLTISNCRLLDLSKLLTYTPLLEYLKIQRIDYPGKECFLLQ